ncbi:hypothetical protein ABNF17_21100, partial [Paenibacillus larvae]
AMNMAPFIFWNLAFYTIIRTQLKKTITKPITDTVSRIVISLVEKLTAAMVPKQIKIIKWPYFSNISIKSPPNTII